MSSAWSEFEHTLRTGESAFEHVFGTDYYAYLAARPDDSGRVDASVRAQNRHVLRTVLHAYPWGALGTVVDVGGGNGAFLAGLLTRFRQLRGTLLDQPHVLAGAPPVLAAAGVEDRCELVAGSFFDEVPAGAGGYVLKTILHDWDDGRALAVLTAVRAAMRPDSRLIVLEALLPPGDTYHVGKLLDLHSLVLVAGPDRDETDLRALLDRAGLRVSDVRPTDTLAILEAVPA
ncbi:methyltransferase [Luedemannella helvata]|uniref:O-methyltransferase C-terminal domain-containing protein n=1 Tax=Luedemannella helvata TaxID=349315 RepID=A0ABP4X367_9ACTN